MRIELTATITAESHECDGWKTVLRALSQIVVSRVPQGADDAIHHSGAHLADFQTAAPVLVRELEAMRRLFDESPETW